MMWKRLNPVLDGFTKRVEGNPIYKLLTIIGELVVLGGLLVGVLVGVRSCSEPSPTSKIISYDDFTDGQKGKSRLVISFDQYLSEIDRRSERFLEKEEFIQASIGKEVEWTVVVVSISSTGDDFISLYFWSEQTAQNNRGLHPPGIATYSSTYKARLFSLRKGDRVMVKGVLRESGGYPFPTVVGSSIEFLPN